jgi:hypothetical protein
LVAGYPKHMAWQYNLRPIEDAHIGIIFYIVVHGIFILIFLYINTLISSDLRRTQNKYILAFSHLAAPIYLR